MPETALRTTASIKTSPETQAKLFDEQKRLVINNKVSRVSEAATSRICTKVIEWYLSQPETTRDSILGL